MAAGDAAATAFVRKAHLKANTSGDRDEDFLVPPDVLLSLLALIRRHLPSVSDATAAEIVTLHRFTREALWRLFIGLKDYICSTEQLSLSPGVSSSGDEDISYAALAAKIGAVWDDKTDKSADSPRRSRA